ncbi:MAG: DUF222 domain-containing protein [Gammaproteobacteria bacterium]
MTSMPPLNTTSSFPVSPLSSIPDSTEELSQELTRLAGHINAAQYRFLKLLSALIERNAWGGDSGIRTPAHWLNYYCGIALGAAREKVRVAKALESLPLIDEAFSTGAISYSKVRAMTRSATPENEEYLLHIARHGTAEHMEKLVRQYRRVERLNRPGEGQKQHSDRALSFYYDEDGMLVIKGRFAPEEGAVVVKALEAAMDSIESHNRTPEESTKVESDNPKLEETEKTAETEVGAEVEADVSAETFPQKRADALVQMAEHFLATRRKGLSGLSNGDKYQVLIHVGAHSQTGLDTGSHLQEGPPLPPATARRLACDASIVPIVEDEQGHILNIGRKSRTIPPAIRRALSLRDKGCRYPGCCNTRYVDAHHIHHWCDGGETSLDNLVLLCRHHHRLLHEGVYTIEKQEIGENQKDQILRFVDSQGRELAQALYPQFEPTEVRIGGRTRLEWEQEQMGLHIDDRTAVTLWRGEKMDYSMAVEGLLKRAPGIYCIDG